MTNPVTDVKQRFWPWLTQEKHRLRAQQLKEGVEHAFTDHPHQTGETYLQHLWFTVSMSMRFAWVMLILLTHGFFPFLLPRTASTQIEHVYRIMKSRIPKARREQLDTYDI